MKATPETMRAAHGATEGRTCNECLWCVPVVRGHASRGTVTGSTCRKAPTKVNGHGKPMVPLWLRRAPACGLFQPGERAT